MKLMMSSPAELPYKLVNFGVDTLVLNVRYARQDGKLADKLLPDVLIVCLNAWQAIAREKEQPVPLPAHFQKDHLLMYPHGAGKGQWRWLLKCPSFNLVISRGKLNGVIAQVRFASSYLWSSEDADTHTQDIWPLVVEVADFLSEMFTTGEDPLDLQVSEVHLCADIAGWDVSACDWQRSFLSRARTRIDQAETIAGGAPVAIVQGRKLATLNFGTHGSPLSCCIYNKALEARNHDKSWQIDICKRHGYNGLDDLWRVEYRWKREALHDVAQEGVFHGIESIHDLAAPVALSYLWTYGAGHTQYGKDGFPDGWLRYAVPTNDQTPTRWPVHPAWSVVQSAFTTATKQAVNVATGEVLDVPLSPLAELIRKRHYEVNVRRLALQLGGCASTLAAWIGKDHLPAVLAYLIKHLPEYALPDLAKVAPPDLLMQEYKRHFADVVEEKRDLYSLRNVQGESEV